MSQLTELVSSFPGGLPSRTRAVTAVLTLLFGVLTYIFPTAQELLDRVAGPDMRYVMVASGIRPDWYPITFGTRMYTSQYEQEDQEGTAIDMVALVVANQSSAPFKTPLTVSVEKLSRPIGELVLETHNFNASMLDECKGEGIFEPEDLAGEYGFCLKIKTFPGRGVISIFILVSADEDGSPLLRDEKLFVGTDEDPHAAKRVQLDRLFAERQRIRINLGTLGLLTVLAVVIWFCRRPSPGQV